MITVPSPSIIMGFVFSLISPHEMGSRGLAPRLEKPYLQV